MIDFDTYEKDILLGWESLVGLYKTRDVSGNYHKRTIQKFMEACGENKCKTATE
jgi:hypothetical protein